MDQFNQGLGSRARWAGIAVTAALVATFFAPARVSAQRMERPTEGYAAGDRLVYSFVLNNKTLIVEEEWSAGTSDEMQGVDKMAGRELPITIARSNYAVLRRMCIANGQACMNGSNGKGLEFVTFPLEQGKQWTTAVTVKGETFSADVTQDRKVEGVERIKVLAGEFEAFKVSYVGRVKGADTRGNRFNGKEEGTDWVALVGGKLVVVKFTYKNSFGDRSERQLISTNWK